MADERKECCKVVENLEKQDTGKPELEMWKCKVCGCRHFELSADPGVYALKGAKI